MQRGDIWLVSEQRGTRPVLIVSPDAFNKLTGVPVVLPITTGGSFARRRGFAVSLEGVGTRTTGVIRCDQPRVLDLGARRGRRIETVPDSIMDDVLARQHQNPTATCMRTTALGSSQILSSGSSSTTAASRCALRRRTSATPADARYPPGSNTDGCAAESPGST